MYDAVEDPYCYSGTTVLKNRAGLRDQKRLTLFETAMAAQRSDEAMPAGRLSVRHYRGVHHHLFQDVYSWAGTFRSVRIGRGASMFCYPENIATETRKLFTLLRNDRFLRGLSAADFAREGAMLLSTLNAIHPFRDGNGRSQLAFFALLASRSGHPLALNRLRPSRFLAAMVSSFQGDDGPLETELLRLIDPPSR